MPGRTTQHDLGAAITRLMSLHDGDRGVIDVIACGRAAIPALHSILQSRDHSGIFETRRRAVEALEALKAYDTLREFLSAPQDIADPVERTGEDAVVNAAARVLGRLGDTRDMPLLFGLLRARPLAGVIEAAGRFRQISTLPPFIDALGDDFTRGAAEDAIRRFGVRARKALLEAAVSPVMIQGRETTASVSRRRSVLCLLHNMPLTAGTLSEGFGDLIGDPDPWIAIWASRIALSCMDRSDQARAVARLLSLLTDADELIAEELEDCLVEHVATARPAIEHAERAQAPSDVPIWRSHDFSDRVFERIRKRMSADSGTQGSTQ
jgi:hypothetical protein